MSKKRVCLITFHWSLIYGGIWQCYATQKYLETLGFEVEVINYLPKRSKLHLILLNMIRPNSQIRKAEVLENKSSFWGFLRKSIYKLYYFCIITKKNKTFVETELNIGPRYESPDELVNNPPIADYYMVGSDQVWNTSTPFEIQDIYPYFLHFVTEGKKIAYSASMGGIPLGSFKQKACSYLKTFSAIGCREQLVLDEISECDTCTTNRAIVLDPSLLIDGNDYSSLIKDNKYKYRFLGTYFRQGVSGSLLRQIFDYKRELGVKWIDMGYDHSPLADKNVIHYGPANWLATISYADIIFTNSFHAVAYSILFKKIFFVVALVGSKKPYNNRIFELLDSLDLMDRVLYFNDNHISLKQLIANKSEIDWDKVYVKLNERRETSYNFLREALDL